MASSSGKAEEVLLSVNHVRCQRVDGTLHLLTERLAWGPTAKQNITLSLKYAEMRQQKISPEGKEKIQMQIVMNDDTSHVFQFVNSKGREAQLEDRASIVSMLQPLIQKFQRKITAEIESKNRVLAGNPNLFQLYKELVVKEVITAEEFWASHAKELEEAHQNATAGKDSTVVPFSAAGESQRIGIPAGFLALLKPQSDEESGGIRYNLTSDVIEQIFRTYPSVKMKHAEYVPHSMPEGDFWAHFFQSHYFHRDRLDAGKNLFSGDQTMADTVTAASLLENDLFGNLSGFIDSDSTLASMAVDTDKSTSSDNQQQAKQRQQLTGKLTPAHINRLIVQRMNFHSERVLTAQVDSEGGTGSTAGPHQKSAAERIVLGDLVSEAPGEREASSSLECANADAYSFCYVSKDAALSNGAAEFSAADIKSVVDSFRDGLATYNPSPFSAFVDDSDLNASIFSSMTTTGDQVAATTTFASLCGGNYSSSLESEYKGLYAALNELLRHFWTCFPVTTPNLEQKLLRMHETLSNFSNSKVKSFEQRLSTAGIQSAPVITAHTRAMLDMAQRKFDAWQARKGAMSKH